MKIYSGIQAFTKINNPIVTIGTFDGVHIGHQKIIQRLRETALECGGEVVLLTFFPHPRMVLHPDDHGLQLLNTMDEKKALLERFGVDHLVIQPFSKDFSRLTSTEFVREILVNQLGVKKLVIGYDHHFGRNREGSFIALDELAPIYNFEVEQIAEQDVDDVAVSSTKIRNALINGDVKTASEFLGYNFELSGKVVEGRKVGRSIGFPTANIAVAENYKIIPANGIYACKVKLKNADTTEVFKGALSIGTRPTFDNGARTIEVFILDFDKNVYDSMLTIEFIERIRDELKFSSVDDLVIQMGKDVEQVRQILIG